MIKRNGSGGRGRIGLLGVLVAVAVAAAPEPDLPVWRTVVHVHSAFSTGPHSLPELTALAREYGIDALFLTDNHALSFQYGLPGLRNTLWLRHQLPSVLQKGPENFYRAAALENLRQQEVLVVPGLEILPRCTWEGSLLEGTLTHWNMQRNLMALGTLPARTAKKIPVSAGWLPRRDTLAAWLSWLGPGLLVLVLVGAIWIPGRAARRRGGSAWKMRGRLLARVGVPLLVFWAGFEWWAGRRPQADLYGDRFSLEAEQRVIDYLDATGAFIYWAHPEAADRHTFRFFKVQTDPYPDILVRTRDYHGFGALYPQKTELYEVGSEWDRVLLDYLQGTRNRPVWAVGEMLYRYEGDARKHLHDVETLIQASERTEAGLLEALKAGQFYIRRRSRDNVLTLNEFTVQPPAERGGHPVVRVALAAEKRGEPVTLCLVRNGAAVHEQQVVPPVRLEFEDPFVPETGGVYYRLVVKGSYPLRLISNPVFINEE